MIEGFQNPGLAIGAALCVVPLIIHLLNRQRHRPQPWAAMRFVLAAYKKTRRQVQLENLLLLLLRMLAVAALAFAIARPFASGDSPLAALREERRDLVLIIDGSASTGYREEVETVFERITGRAAELIEELDESRGDRVRMVFAGATPRSFPMMGPIEAASILETLESPMDESMDLAAAIGDVASAIADDLANGVSSAVDVRLLTDLQASSFAASTGRSAPRANNTAGDGTATDDPSQEEQPAALAEELAILDGLEVRVVVEDLGTRAMRPDNLSVQSISILGEPPRAGVPFEVAISIANFGDKDLLAERVALSIGGERLPSQRVDIPAQGTAEAVFTAEIAVAGHHALTTSLEGDRLGVDDQRSLVVHLPEPLEVLVVNGAPADRLEEDEVGFLLAVLEPPDDSLGGGSISPFAVRVISPAGLSSEDAPIEEADVIILANVPAVSSSATERLEARVAAGAGLFITAGDRMGDLDQWSENLLRDDDTGLLPAKLQRRVAAARRTTYYRAASFDETSPGLFYFTDEKRRPLLTEVPFYEFIASLPMPGARVLARFDDSAGSPLLVERAYGSGKVLLWTSSIDPAWNRVPDSGKTFVPLMLELLQNLRTAEDGARTVGVGDDVTVVVDDFPRGAALVRPSGGQQPIDGDAVELPDKRWGLPRLPGDLFAEVGVYEVRTEAGLSEPIAVQLAAGESDLARATAAEIEAIHPALVVAELAPDGSAAETAANQPRRGEIWRWLAMAALLFLVGESLFGAYIGRRRGATS